MDERHLVIMGPMGVGKTTLAELLGQRLGRPVRDSDTDLRALFGRSGRSIAAERGVDALHELEAAVLLGALLGPDPAVIAAAGWTVEHPDCRAALARRATVVVLDLAPDLLVTRLAEAEAAAARAGEERHRRPMSADEISAVARSRRAFYDEVADLRLQATELPERLVEGVLAGMAPST